MEAVASIRWGPLEPRRRFRPARTAAGSTHRFGGPLLVVLSSASLQTSAALATTVFAVYGAAGTGALRFAFAAPVLLLLARPTLRGRSRRFWLGAATFGAMLAALNFVLYEAIARASLGTVVTLQFLGPLGLAVLGMRRRLDALWIAAAGAGVVALTGGPGGAATLGVGLALVAAALTALSLLMAGRLASESSGLDGLAVAVGVAACLTLPLAIPAVSVKAFSVLLSLDPAVALLAGALWLGQTLAPREVLGAGLVVVASAGVTATR